MNEHCELVVFDTEFTAWPGSVERQWSGPDEHRELIQLAGVRLQRQGQQLQVVNSFNELIKPTLNPQLSSYIVSLTGIDQPMLDEMAVDYDSALTLFHQFCHHGALPCYSWGPDEAILIENCHLHQTPLPSFKNGMFDLKARLIQEGLEIQHLCSGELAEYCGVDVSGHLHNALHDVRSIAASLNVWLQQGKINWDTLKNS